MLNVFSVIFFVVGVPVQLAAALLFRDRLGISFCCQKCERDRDRRYDECMWNVREMNGVRPVCRYYLLKDACLSELSRMMRLCSQRKRLLLRSSGNNIR